MQDDCKLDNKRWRYRRRIAYLSLLSILLSLLLSFFVDLSEVQGRLIEGICLTLGVIVISYFGGNAAELFKKSREK